VLGTAIVQFVCYTINRAETAAQRLQKSNTGAKIRNPKHKQPPGHAQGGRTSLQCTAPKQPTPPTPVTSSDTSIVLSIGLNRRPLKAQKIVCMCGFLPALVLCCSEYQDCTL
jgi:hypothetical protein